MRQMPAGSDFDGWVHQLSISQRRQLAKHHLMASGPAALPAVRRGLRHPAAVVRRVCTSLLDRLVDEDSLPDLVAALDDEDDGVLARALHALACDQCKQNACRPGEDLFVPRALDLLRSHPNPDVRAAAIDALGKVAAHRPEVVAALAVAIEHDPDVGLRGMARHRMPRAPLPVRPA